MLQQELDTLREEGGFISPIRSRSRRGSLVLVGDAKQAIYRWRGGKAEQFLRLIDGSGNPFSLEPGREALPRNYRSHRPLIEFNNDFFSHLSRYMRQEAYAELFLTGTRQSHQHDKPGEHQADPGVASPVGPPDEEWNPGNFIRNPSSQKASGSSVSYPLIELPAESGR